MIKKIAILLSYFVLLTAFQCEDEPLEGTFLTDDEAACLAATQNSSDALVAFDEATPLNYTERCNAYKAALENEINTCGDPNGSLQALIDSLGDCIVDTPPEGAEISVVVGTLLIEFDVVEVVVNGTTLEVSGEDTSAGYTIYFEVEQDATGVDIINATFVIHLTSEFFPSTQGFDDFTSEITENSTGTLIGTFNGLVTNASGADVSLTQGMINIEY